MVKIRRNLGCATKFKTFDGIFMELWNIWEIQGEIGRLSSCYNICCYARVLWLQSLVSIVENCMHSSWTDWVFSNILKTRLRSWSLKHASTYACKHSRKSPLQVCLQLIKLYFACSGWAAFFNIILVHDTYLAAMKHEFYLLNACAPQTSSLTKLIPSSCSYCPSTEYHLGCQGWASGVCFLRPAQLICASRALLQMLTNNSYP